MYKQTQWLWMICATSIDLILHMYMYMYDIPSVFNYSKFNMYPSTEFQQRDVQSKHF